MEAFGIIGMVFGIMGMGLGASAFTQLQGVTKDLAELKKELTESGVLKGDGQTEAGK